MKIVTMLVKMCLDNFKVAAIKWVAAVVMLLYYVTEICVIVIRQACAGLLTLLMHLKMFKTVTKLNYSALPQNSSSCGGGGVKQCNYTISYCLTGGKFPAFSRSFARYPLDGGAKFTKEAQNCSHTSNGRLPDKVYKLITGRF